MQVLKKHIIICILSAVVVSTPAVKAAFTDGDTLAIVGKKIITTDYYLELYKQKLLETGIQDNNEIREKYLKNLIDDELLINDARGKNFLRIDSVKQEVERLKLQELLNLYSLAHISPDVKITDDDLKDLYIKLNTRVKVRHLYAETKEKADSLYNELKTGKTFELLAAENFNDPVLKNNGGLIGYITVDETDPEFEKTVYSLKVGEISAPVKTVQGYSIIRVDDIISNPLVTESEFLKAKERLSGYARKRAFEEASKNYAQKLKAELNTTFNDKGVGILFNALHPENGSLSSENPVSIAKDQLNEVVLSSKMGSWNLQNVLDEMDLVTDRQIRLVKTKENLKDFLSGLVNRSYIKQKAFEEGITGTEIYKKKSLYAEETYLLTLNELELKKEIIIPEDSAKSFYNNNRSRFVRPAEIRLSSILVDNAGTSDTVINLLNTGAAFEEVAVKYSIQKQTAEKGGDMGYFKKEELENIGADVFSIPEGKWGGPFTEEGKFLFLKNTGMIPEGIKPFDEVKDEIINTLSTFSFYNKREDYTNKLKEKITVLVYPEKLKSIKLTNNS